MTITTEQKQKLENLTDEDEVIEVLQGINLEDPVMNALKNDVVKVFENYAEPWHYTDILELLGEVDEAEDLTGWEEILEESERGHNVQHGFYKVDFKGKGLFLFMTTAAITWYTKTEAEEALEMDAKSK